MVKVHKINKLQITFSVTILFSIGMEHSFLHPLLQITKPCDINDNVEEILKPVSVMYFL